MIQVPIRVFRNSYTPLFLSRFGANEICCRSHLPNFLGTTCSSSAFSAPAVSVSMPVVLRGAKKLLVNTAIVGRLKAADVGICLDDFFPSVETCSNS
jgi:hypothetical protein